MSSGMDGGRAGYEKAIPARKDGTVAAYGKLEAIYVT